MAPSAGNLMIDITTNVARLTSDMGKVSRIVGSTFSGIKNIVGGVGFLALGKEALQLGDEISKASEKLGIGAEKLSAMRYAAELSDVSFEALQKGMKKFSQAIIEANAAGSDAATAFSVMGIATKDIQGKTKGLDVLFSEVANAFMKMEDGAGKVSIAVALFGRAGMDMIPILNKGASGIREMEKEAGRLGATISEKTAKQLEEANDNLKSFWMSVKGLTASIAGGLLGAIKKMGDAFSESLGAGEGFSFGPDARKFKGPPLPPKTVAPNLDEIKKAMEERKKLEEDYQKRQLKLLNERADALALFYGDDAEMAKIVGDEDIKRGEIAIKLMKERILYAEDLRGTMDALGVADPEMDLAEGMANIGNIVKEVSPQVQRMMDEWYQKTQAVANLYATVFRGEDGVIADMANTAISAFHGMTDALTDFVMTGKKNFTNFANSVIADIMRIAIRQAIVQPIAQGLMGAIGFAAPARASGGPVMGGSPYLVGERGPELFVPSSSGSIVPNGGGDVTVNVYNQSGQQIKASNTKVSTDSMGRTVIGLWLQGYENNVMGLRTALGGA